MTALTDSAIKAMRPGDRLKDDRVPGLEIRAHKSGKSFLMYYRTRTGKERRPRIGAYDKDAMPLSKARDIARDWLAQVAAGRDPAAEWEEAREAPTVDDLWTRVEQEHYNDPETKRWHVEAKRLYESNAKPKIGRKTVAEIRYTHIAEIKTALEDQQAEANNTLSVLGKMFNLAEKWEMRPDGSNPRRFVEKYPARRRTRYATPVEIAKIGPILDRLAKDKRNVPGVAFLYLLAFSGARPSEIGNGRPDQVERVEKDGKVYGVLRMDGKTGARNVFLPPQAMAVLDKLPADRATLAGRKTVPKKLWAKVRKEAGCPDLWARDWRRTFGTTALSSGVSLGQVGELLGHASVQTTKIYAKLLEDSAHQAAAGVASQMEALMKQPVKEAAE